jgi:hypothetical protein
MGLAVGYIGPGAKGINEDVSAAMKILKNRFTAQGN